MSVPARKWALSKRTGSSARRAVLNCLADWMIGEDAEVLRRRRETMLEARRRHPERWISGRVLNCTPIKEVWLNPENGQLEEKHAKAA